MRIADQNPWYEKDTGLAALLEQKSLITELQHAVADVLTRVEEMAVKAFLAAQENDWKDTVAPESLLTMQQQHIQAARERFIEAFAHLRITTSGKTL